MKEVIRENCFETNSSSNHTLSVYKEENMVYDLYPSDDGYVYCSFGEFGWEIENYCDSGTKLTYALTMVAETEKYTSEEEFYETEGFQIINNCIKECMHCNGVIVENSGICQKEYKDWHGNVKKYTSHTGYIDHQSSDFDSLSNFLELNNLTIERFIFDENVILHTDNDNH